MTKTYSLDVDFLRKPLSDRNTKFCAWASVEKRAFPSLETKTKKLKFVTYRK